MVIFIALKTKKKFRRIKDLAVKKNRNIYACLGKMENIQEFSGVPIFLYIISCCLGFISPLFKTIFSSFSHLLRVFKQTPYSFAICCFEYGVCLKTLNKWLKEEKIVLK